ncbi:angiotensin-converting enzyme-like [Lycorma delicatula]|uniref:angiotensin-converting enzyme-like n=1 Tax=Lycorma delicatula TaxID=130591 RepID=UPI003F517A3E
MFSSYVMLFSLPAFLLFQIILSPCNSVTSTRKYNISGITLSDKEIENIYSKIKTAYKELKSDKPLIKRKRRMHSAFRFLFQRNTEILNLQHKAIQFKWKYEANTTEYNKQRMMKTNLLLANGTKKALLKVLNYPWTDELNEPVVRRFYKKTVIMLEELVLSEEKLKLYRNVMNHMEDTYNSAKVCEYKNKKKCDLSLEADLKKIFATSRDPEELKYYWAAWRNATGKKLKNSYNHYLELINEIAVLHNFTDVEQMWNDNYQSQNFTSEVYSLWMAVRPLYLQLHAYARNRLRKVYGKNLIPLRGPIPAHLFGNVWAETWENIYNITAPYPERPLYNLTAEMIKQKFTPLRMFRMAENFYESLALSPMTGLFWDRSIFQRIENRTMDCTPSAWDFHGLHDYRIKMCTEVTFEDFLTVYYEMGNIEHFMQYRNKPLCFRKSADEAFYDAFASIVPLSVITPNHLKRIGLIPKDAKYDYKMEINQLYLTALKKIAILPYSYLMDFWRWDVFKKLLKPENYNRYWWDLRLNIQGMSPPLKRNDDDFDPGANYNIIKSVPHIKYFMSIFHQFQYYRQYCNYSIITNSQSRNSRNHLHLCDIYGCKECGHFIWKQMFWGYARSWRFIMDSTIEEWWNDVDSVKQYFSPLMQWLQTENKRSNEYIGW